MQKIAILPNKAFFLIFNDKFVTSYTTGLNWRKSKYMDVSTIIIPVVFLVFHWTVAKLFLVKLCIDQKNVAAVSVSPEGPVQWDT